MIKIGNINLGEFPLLLAPMEDVSDPPFRYVCKQKGADLMYTEFISSEGLIRDAAKSIKKLDIFEYERPIGVQLYGGNIEAMKEATAYANKIAQEENDMALEGVKKSGKTTVYAPTKEEKLAFKKAMATVHVKMADRVGKDLLQSIYKETGFDPTKL